MKIGICGGTFDPFHRGHLEPIIAVRGTMQWERLIYVPASRQPYKADRESASPFHRFAMAVLATEETSGVSVSPRELERGSVSYTVDTLEEMRKEHPADTLDWIVGDDNLSGLEGWRRIDRIFELANFAVLTRNPEGSQVPPRFRDRVAAPASRPPQGAIVFAHNEAVPVSATEVRRRLRAGQSISDLVHPRVSRYIQQNRLYGEAQT